MFPKTHKDPEISVRLSSSPRATQLVHSIARWSPQYCLSVPQTHSRPHYLIFVGLVIFWKTFLRIITASTRIVFLFLKTSIIMQCPSERLLVIVWCSQICTDVCVCSCMCVYFLRDFSSMLLEIPSEPQWPLSSFTNVISQCHRYPLLSSCLLLLVPQRPIYSLLTLLKAEKTSCYVWWIRMNRKKLAFLFLLKAEVVLTSSYHRVLTFFL